MKPQHLLLVLVASAMVAGLLPGIHMAGGIGAASLFGFGLFSRFGPRDLDRHASRLRLREAIRSAPGISLGRLGKETGLPKGTLVYHLNRLEAAGLVRSLAVARQRIFFLPEHGRPTRDAVLLQYQPAKVRLLEFLKSRPGACQTELAGAAGISRALAHRYLAQLEAEQLVASSRDWRRRLYVPGPAMIGCLSRILPAAAPPTPPAVFSSSSADS